VIRRILRRAIRYGFTFLNIKEPFIYQLVAVLADQMGEVFPEIKNNKV
jgi:alanyl-tRNA synthetase